ncbi:MAG: hypothetical protein AB7I48_01235 [Planctomycetaceae bacterium]
MSAFVNKCPKCGTKVKLRSRELDGKKARCPRCSSAFRIKAPPPPPPPKAKGPKSERKPPSVEFAFLGRITDDDLADFGPVDEEAEELDELRGDDDFSEPQPRASKTQSASSRKTSQRKVAWSARHDLLIGAVVIGLGLLLLGGVGFFAMQYLPGVVTGGAASRLAWMPDDIEGFVEIEPNALWEARALRPLREAKVGVNLREHFDKLLSPVVMSDIERIAVGFPPPGSPHPEPVFVLYAKSSWNESQLTSQAADFQPVSHGGQSYLVGRQPPRAAYFAASNVLVYGVEDQIKSAIDRAGVCAAADQFNLPGRGTIVFAARNPQRFGTPSLLPIAGQEAGLTAETNGLTGFAFVLDVVADFALSGTLSYDSAESAQALVTSTQEHIQQQTAALEFSRNERLNTDPSFKLNLYGVKQFLTAQLALLRSVNINHSGANVAVELTIPSFLFEFSFQFFEFFAADLFPDAAGMDEEPDDAEMPDDAGEPQE